ncbi:MAG: rRNA maturation RNase YbeY [Pirellulaceae bacterium]|jgi:probable rRNA maturation factor|nr:rRNA maturation RNase YbeY [Pirellulaceae bacterium]
MPLVIEVAAEIAGRTVDEARLKRAVHEVLAKAGIRAGEVSIAVVTDPEMHALNRQYLDHDYPTDVLSFVLEYDEERAYLEGQIIASIDYAAKEAERFGWSAEDELLLYVIHGALHLVGHDDHTPAGRAAMRKAEAEHLARFGLLHRYDE